jgi:hypothetical protein
MNYKKTDFLILPFLALFVGCGGSGTTASSVKPAQNHKLQTTQESQNIIETDIQLDEKKFLHVVSKITYNLDENVTTTYTYKNNHLEKLEKVSTMGRVETKKYRYFQDDEIVKTYDSSDVVKAVAIFTKLQKPEKSYIYDNRLSLNEDINYMLLPYDSLKVLDKKHINKLIYPDTTGNIYTYDAKDNLLSIENGYFDDNASEVFSQIEDDENTSFLLGDVLAFHKEQSSDYLYDKSDRLKSVSFKGSTDVKTGVDVSFYENGSLRDMNISTGGSFHYTNDGLLQQKIKVKNGKKNISNYTYSKDLKTVSLKNGSDKLVTIYKFQEINKGTTDGK